MNIQMKQAIWWCFETNSTVVHAMKTEKTEKKIVVDIINFESLSRLKLPRRQCLLFIFFFFLRITKSLSAKKKKK